MKTAKPIRLLSLLLAVALAVTLAPAALAVVWDALSAAPRAAAGGAYSITLSASSLNLDVGATQTLTATISGGNVLPAGHTIAWSSSDTNEVSVRPGNGGFTATVTALDPAATNDPTPEVTITVQLMRGTQVVDSDNCDVLVRAADSTGLEIINGDQEVEPGGSFRLYARTLPEGAADQPVTWSSSDETLVKVAEDGTITAGSTPGEATITATSEEGYTARCTITVRGIVLDPAELTIRENRTGSLTLRAYGAALQGQTATWVSSDTNVVTVSSGYLQPVGVGTATISASMQVNSRPYTATAKVTVERAQADVIRASADAGNPLHFAGTIASQLDEQCRSVVGESLSYVTGLRVSTSQGTLYYRYRSENDTGTGIGTNENYYVSPRSGQLDLDDVTFVPKADFSGTAVISYTGYAAGGSFFQGTIEVTVAATEGIRYTVAADQAVQFNAADFNQACNRRTGRNLSYVVFSLPNSSRGTLRYNYLSPSNSGTAVTTDAQYRRSGTPALSNVYFVPSGGYTGTVTVSYTGYDVQNTSFRGTVTIRVTQAAGGQGDLRYTVARGGRLTFDDDDFNDLSRDITGSSLDYVQFQLPASSAGTLYYNYSSSGGYDSRVTESQRYYRSSSPYLRRVTFVAAEDYTGTVEIDFTAWDIRGNTFSGTVEIAVGLSGSGDIRYSCSRGGSVTFDDNDFNALSRELTGSTLSSVQFQLPASSRGTLYYNYSGGDYDSRVSASRSYYRSASPYLDRVTFVAASGYTGTVTIDFTGRSTGGDTFSGSVVIGVDTVEDEISYTVRAGSYVTFDEADFDDLCQDLTGDRLRYVRFTLPASSRGTLYYEYQDDGDSGSRVSASRSYYRTSSPYLNRVSFVPASGYTGTVAIDFTGWSTDGERFQGTVSVTVQAPAGASVIYYSTDAQPVRFQARDFSAACEARGQGSLSYVRFSLPNSSAGSLRYQYQSLDDQGTQVRSTANYYVSQSPALGDVSFVPRVGYTGTVVLTYTGYDSRGGTYQGTVQVTVRQRTTSQHFTDLGGTPWAVTAIDFLYENGVVQGVGGTQYGPSRQITRGDFVLMLVRAYDLTGQSGNGFRDVPTTSYYAQAIATAQGLGIAGGYPDGTFRPRDPITRQEAVVFLQRTMQAAGWSLGAGNEALLSGYLDGATVSAFARSAMALMIQYGILSGTPEGNLRPTAPITRAETAVMLARALTL